MRQKPDTCGTTFISFVILISKAMVERLQRAHGVVNHTQEAPPKATKNVHHVRRMEGQVAFQTILSKDSKEIIRTLSYYRCVAKNEIQEAEKHRMNPSQVQEMFFFAPKTCCFFHVDF